MVGKTEGKFSNVEPLPCGRYFAFSKIIYRYAFGENDDLDGGENAGGDD